MERNAENLTTVIRKYLERRKIYSDSDDPAWEIRKSKLGGFGVFAKRRIEVGQIVFKDCPVILGPRAVLACSLICVNCYSTEDLKPCDKLCGLRLCSKNKECENSRVHQKECKIIRQWRVNGNKKIDDEEFSKELTKVLSPIRSLIISDDDKTVVKFLKAHKSNKHGFEVDIMKNVLQLNIKEDEECFMRLVCSVLDSNAFEVIVGNNVHQSSVKGLYPLSSLANHSCTPNTTHVFDSKQNMIVLPTRLIKKDEEIFHSYSRFIWGTLTRRFHLIRTKHFLCKCERCEDPTEFGSYMSAIVCRICKVGKVVPINSLSVNGKWQCDRCAEVIDRQSVATVTSLLGSVLETFSNNDLEEMLRFLDVKLKELVSENNEVAVELKCKIVWILGYQQNFFWTELPERLLLTKERFCRDLLHLLEILCLGQCKMRGLLLYELYSVLNELKSRQRNSSGKDQKKSNQEMRNVLSEAADILKYDVSAPVEIKEFWMLEENNDESSET